jgi:hypothetical protein
MLAAGFEPTLPPTQRQQTHAFLGVCVGFAMCGWVYCVDVCMCGCVYELVFCNVWVCVRVGFFNVC